MRLATPADKGEWFVFTEDERSREKAEFEIRRVPAAVEREIEVEVLGRKRQAKFKKGVQLVDYDLDQSEEITYRKAAYALVGSRGADLPWADIPALLPGPEDDPQGFVRLDGRWTADVKRQVFEAFPAIAVWIVKKANGLDAQAREDEEGKGATS